MSAATKRRVVLFSGGTASNLLAHKLAESGVEVTNVVAVFDNGGSTGALRRISPLPMPAVGDIRNRLVALSASKTPSELAVRNLFEARLSERKSEKQLREELTGFIEGSHHLLSGVPGSSKPAILQALKVGTEVLPASFPLRELSLGNLLLFGRMLQTRDVLEAIHWARELLRVESEVLPVTLDSVHLGALCQGGQWVLGQWAITKEPPTFPGRVERICFLQDEKTYAWEATASVCPEVAEVLNKADAFIVGFGSFLTSILPQFLVKGIGAAFVRRSIPRLFLCNQTVDKETAQFTVASMIQALAQYALADTGGSETARPPITHILHFGADQDRRIPAGNVSALEAGYLDFPETVGTDAIADKACDVILSTIGIRPAPVIHPKASSKSTVVLFDLDATLFDYVDLRLRATSAALEGIVGSPEAVSRELLDLLRPPLSDILAVLGEFPDLRREWGSKEVLALGCLLNEASSRQDLLDLANATTKLDASEEDVSLRSRVERYQYASQLRDVPAGIRFMKSLTSVRNRWDQFFPKHVEVFRKYVRHNAILADGAKALITELMDLNVEIHVVSEGDSAIQMFKFYSLGLEELVHTCVVTDATCSVTPILNELFTLYRDSKAVPEEVERLYDQLAPYTVKSPAFFSKLLHALADPSGGGLQERVQSAHFLTKGEWQSSSAFSAVMIGDRYRKDLEPLLRVCSSGAKAYRLLTGRYYREDPLHEILDERRPVPNGIFPDLQELRFLSTSIAAADDAVNRPAPFLPDPMLVERVLGLCRELSETSRTALMNLKSEALRHEGDD